MEFPLLERESQTIEFKSSFNIATIESLVAFAIPREEQFIVAFGKAIKDYPTMQFTYRETQGGYLAELSYEKQKNSTEVPNKENGKLNGKLNGELNGELNKGQKRVYEWLKAGGVD